MNCLSTLMYEPEPEIASTPTRATSAITVANWLASRFATRRALVLN